MKKNRMFSLAALGLGVLLISGSASAYVLLTPARTWNCPPNYTVDNTGIASITDSDGGAAAVVSAIATAASSSDAWNDAGSARVITAHKGSTSSFTVGDGVPMVKFSDPLSVCTGNCLAATFVTFYSERSAGSGSYRIDDADVVTNLSYNWTSQSEDPGGAGCSNEVYIEGVMVHEIGHALGLDHTGASGATMYPTVSYCNNNPATTETDDENGLVALYGTAPCTSSLFSPCLDHTNYLTGTGDSDVQPCGGSFTLGGSGTIRGWSVGPGLSDFDLYLDKWNGFTWVVVASGTTLSSSDSVTYSGTAGTYRFRVVSYSGPGTYHFWYQRPTLFL